MKKVLKILFYLLLASFIGIQFVPFGRDHQNPAVISEPTWDDPGAKELAVRACYDCHSNETVWPWYSHVAPVSWLVYRDVVEGRRHFNFSDWERYSRGQHELAEVVSEGEMPLPVYLPMHPEARLTSAEKQQLIQGFQALK